MSGVLVVGAGEMAAEYLKVLRALGVPASVASRGEKRAKELAESFGAPWTAGGLPDAVPGKAIVAVSPQALAEVARELAARGCRSILLEKPGALSSTELAGLPASTTIAYNRRFYPSVEAARTAIAEDGGVLSGSFEFTELEDRVLPSAAEKGFPPEVLERWGVANSLHVIDLFLFLAGRPSDWQARRAGSLEWHPSGAVFAGAGETDRGAQFGYTATWGGAGGWGVELTTSRRKLVLRPLERLAVQEKGRFAADPVEVEAEPDGLKPGLHGLVRAWLAGDGDPRLCGLDEAAAHMRVAERIFGYPA